MQRVLHTIEKLEGDTTPVLITGESGVGKELVARAVHLVSPLAGRVFLPVDSASLVGSLMESELFGHTKGAFTGAVEQKSGLVRAADGGTLFLDEIGELPPEVQAKLLRLLQEGEIRPIGATRPIPVSVRIVAATNRDLETDVKAARFRKDLYYRLNVINIHLPPLRERREDIPDLIAHFSRRYAIHQVSLSDEVMEAFLAYHWPGNVRELENAIRRTMALKSNPVIQVSDLPSALRNFSERLHSPGDNESDILPLAEVERRHILKAVEATQGDMATAALMLQIGRTTLYRKIKQYRTEAPGADLESLDAALWSSRAG
jgi:two-component system response regulator HydG